MQKKSLLQKCITKLVAFKSGSYQNLLKVALCTTEDKWYAVFEFSAGPWTEAAKMAVGQVIFKSSVV